MASVSHPFQHQTSETTLPQTEILDEPNILDTDDVPTLSNENEDDSEGFDVEILDSGSDVDIFEESQLKRFSRMLYKAQKKALAKEKAKGNKWKSYSGHS